MVNTDTVPALPWGAASAETSAATQPSSVPARTSLASADVSRGFIEAAERVERPTMGSKIEVKWLVEEGEQVEIMWWKAQVEAAGPEHAGTPHVATLRYQPYHNFDEEIAVARFLPEGRLCHMDKPAEQLRWRAEGEDVDESDDEDTDGMVMDAGDLDEEAQVLERELGVSAEQVMEQQLRSYPLDQQRHLASGYRNFVEHFRENLGQLAQSQGGNYTVTESDVRNIFRTLNK